MVGEPIRVPEGLTTDGLLGRRYLARAIDSFLLGLLVYLIGSGAASFLPIAQTGPTFELVISAIRFVFWIAIGSFFESSPWQATPGKRLMGLRVYDQAGGRIDFPQAVSRNVIKDGPFLILASLPKGQLLSLVWLGAHIFVVQRSPVCQAIHDSVAGTWVAAPESTIQLHLH